MDSKNKLDQLFREKLFSEETTPSAMAWDQVNRKINKRKPVIWYWLAASVAAILIFSLVLWPYQNTRTGVMIANVDHPVLLDTMRIEIPYRKSRLSNQMMAVEEAPNTEQTKNTFAENTQKPMIDFAVMDVLILTSKKPTLSMDWPTSDLGMIQKKRESENRPTVKITYIASEKPAVDTTEARVINKFWSMAQNLTSTTVLADLRDAKNNLFVKNQP
ncbi:MAG: hypothetical protein RIA69_02025 [Cyclobacteriaceae bacterium]